MKRTSWTTGWFGESKRHSLASKGVKTGRKKLFSNKVMKGTLNSKREKWCKNIGTQLEKSVCISKFEDTGFESIFHLHDELKSITGEDWGIQYIIPNKKEEFERIKKNTIIATYRMEGLNPKKASKIGKKILYVYEKD